MSNFLKDLRLHYESIDWSDPSHTATSLGKQMMGPCGYLAGLSQEEAARKEIDILHQAGHSKWDGSSEYKPYYQHFLTLAKLILPNRDITTNLADAVMLFCGCTGNQRKLLNLIGSQDSGKSSATAVIAFVCLAISPFNTAVYIANPFDAAADSTIWGDVLETFHTVQESSPWLWPQAKAYETKYIQLIPNVPKAAMIELRGVKEVGKFKGMKTVKNRPGEPMLLVAIDEVNEIKNQAFLKILSNITSQFGFIAITTQNFTDEANMGGVLCAPKALYPGCPGNYRELDQERDLFWHSHLSSVTLRFNGLKSPNILSGRTIYPYLFRQSNLDLQLTNYGRDSAEFYSQVLSFPTVGSAEMTVLSRTRWDNSRCEDKDFTFDRIAGRVAFCDPAFGGGDKAMWGVADFGHGSSVVGDGQQREEHPILQIPTHFQQLHVSTDEVVTTQWLVRARNVGVDVTQFIIGDRLSPEEQVAIQCAEYNMQYLIPPSHFGFDFSMRHEIVTAMSSIVGKAVIPFSYNEGPGEIWLESFKKSSKDLCNNRVSELAFLCADLFMLRQIRGGQFVRDAIEQLCKTKYEIRSKKYCVESKKDYKARNAGKSPDHRDTLMGLAGMANIKGFHVRQLSKGQVTSVTQLTPITNRFLKKAKSHRI